MRFRSLAIWLASAALSACAGAPTRVPQGVEVVEEQAPPPPPAAIEEAQRRLHAEDLYRGPVDAMMTPALRVAIARFQRVHELKVTGTLDQATAAALGISEQALLPSGGGQPAGRAGQVGPSAAEILELEEVPTRPQPPPGALEDARSAAAKLLASGSRQAAAEVETALQIPPSAGENRRAAEPGREQRTGAEAVEPGDLLAAARAAGSAEGSLASARSQAFELLLQARRAGGWALLPAPLIAELERELQARSLLLRGPDGKLGPDDEAAIRWVQRSNGLEPTGVPTLRLLEALGIDPGPMFAPP